MKPCSVVSRRSRGRLHNYVSRLLRVDAFSSQYHVEPALYYNYKGVIYAAWAGVTVALEFTEQQLALREEQPSELRASQQRRHARRGPDASTNVKQGCIDIIVQYYT